MNEKNINSRGTHLAHNIYFCYDRSLLNSLEFTAIHTVFMFLYNFMFTYFYTSGVARTFI